MKSVTVTIKDEHTRELFKQALIEHNAVDEFRRASTTDWYMNFPNEIDYEDAKIEVEEAMWCLGMEKGKDFEF